MSHRRIPYNAFIFVSLVQRFFKKQLKTLIGVFTVSRLLEKMLIDISPIVLLTFTLVVYDDSFEFSLFFHVTSLKTVFILMRQFLDGMWVFNSTTTHCSPLWTVVVYFWNGIQWKTVERATSETNSLLHSCEIIRNANGNTEMPFLNNEQCPSLVRTILSIFLSSRTTLKMNFYLETSFCIILRPK